jgi:hypothetical protein
VNYALVGGICQCAFKYVAVSSRYMLGTVEALLNSSESRHDVNLPSPRAECEMSLNDDFQVLSMILICKAINALNSHNKQNLYNCTTFA